MMLWRHGYNYQSHYFQSNSFSWIEICKLCVEMWWPFVYILIIHIFNRDIESLKERETVAILRNSITIMKLSGKKGEWFARMFERLIFAGSSSVFPVHCVIHHSFVYILNLKIISRTHWLLRLYNQLWRCCEFLTKWCSFRIKYQEKQNLRIRSTSAKYENDHN